MYSLSSGLKNSVFGSLPELSCTTRTQSFRSQMLIWDIGPKYYTQVMLAQRFKQNMFVFNSWYTQAFMTFIREKLYYDNLKTFKGR